MHVKSDWGRKGGGKTCGKGIPVQITRGTKSLRSWRVSANDAKSCGMRSQRRPEKNSVFYKLSPEPPLPAVDHRPPFLLFPSSKTKHPPQTCSSLSEVLISLSRSFSTALTQLSFLWREKFGLPDRLEPEIGEAWGLVPEKTLGCWGAALGFCPGWGSQGGQGPSRTRALRCPVPGGGDARAPRQPWRGGGVL